MKRVYLDHNATTPMRAQVRAEFVRESHGAWEVLGLSPDATVEQIKALASSKS